jgi:hypothetical protein
MAIDPIPEYEIPVVDLTNAQPGQVFEVRPVPTRDEVLRLRLDENRFKLMYSFSSDDVPDINDIPQLVVQTEAIMAERYPERQAAVDLSLAFDVYGPAFRGLQERHLRRYFPSYIQGTGKNVRREDGKMVPEYRGVYPDGEIPFQDDDINRYSMGLTTKFYQRLRDFLTRDYPQPGPKAARCEITGGPFTDERLARLKKQLDTTGQVQDNILLDTLLVMEHLAKSNVGNPDKKKLIGELLAALQLGQDIYVLGKWPKPGIGAYGDFYRHGIQLLESLAQAGDIQDHIGGKAVQASLPRG